MVGEGETAECEVKMPMTDGHDNFVHMQMLNYNVPHGKLNRGMAVLDAVKALAPAGQELSAEQVHKARVLGWCIEFVRFWHNSRV